MNWNIFTMLCLEHGNKYKNAYKTLSIFYGNKYCDALYLLLLGSISGKNRPQNIEVPHFKTYCFLLDGSTFFIEKMTTNPFKIILIFHNHFSFDLPFV